MDALPTMERIDPNDGAALIVAETVPKLPFVIFVRNKALACFLEAMDQFHAIARRDHPNARPIAIHADADPWWSDASGSTSARLTSYFAGMAKP